MLFETLIVFKHFCRPPCPCLWACAPRGTVALLVGWGGEMLVLPTGGLRVGSGAYGEVGVHPPVGRTEK